MIEAGLRLSLKDNMSATIQKNIKLQREFSQQVEQANLGVRSLGKAKADPIITARDQATKVVESVRSTIEQVANAVATPEVEIKDKATSKADEILERIRELKKMAVSPVVRLKDKVTDNANKLKRKLKELATNYTPIVRIRDKASQGISKIKNTLGGLVKKPYQALLKVKDEATKIISKVKEGLKTIGNTTARAMVAVKDGASAGLSKMGGMLKTLAKGVTIGVTLAGAGATALLTGSLSAGANLQQSIGGVETLYGADAGAVMANADNAFKTAGLSANEYMEQVTSFSASLLNSLGGDTAKSAMISDMAITDMADNANKFGTDMADIQNAYQGFAKQNYTMLDNLKLGYAGTESEMQRLLKDATAITGVKYNIDNLADVYSAVHAIQENLGVAGTTAKEASSTFSGSFASMKASVSNLLGNLALGGDITSSMEQVVESASTFLFDNAIPMIGNVFTALPSAIKTGIEKSAPKIKEAGKAIITSLKDGIVTMFPSLAPVFGGIEDLIANSGGLSGMLQPFKELLVGGFDGLGGAIQQSLPSIQSVISTLGGAFNSIMPVIKQVRGAFVGVFPQIVEAVSSTIPLINPIVEGLSANFSALIPVVTGIISTFSQTVSQVMPIVSQVFSSVVSVVVPIIQTVSGLIQSAFPIIQNVITMVTNAIASVMPTISTIFEGVGGKIQQIVGVVQKHMGLFQSIFETVSPIVQGAIEILSQVFSTAWNIISPIVDLAIQIFDGLLTCVEAVFPTIQSVVESVWSVLEGIFGAIADGLSVVGDAISGVAEFVGNGIDTIGSWFGFAYGKDRVPYDNYPAVLHQGEKVLTRNQADQYDRQMSTRGVQLNNAIQPVPRDTGGGSSNAPVVEATEEKTGAGGTTINLTMENTFTGDINNMGDMDSVVDAMAEKFVKRMRKLVPNMT